MYKAFTAIMYTITVCLLVCLSIRFGSEGQPDHVSLAHSFASNLLLLALIFAKYTEIIGTRYVSFISFSQGQPSPVFLVIGLAKYL